MKILSISIPIQMPPNSNFFQPEYFLSMQGFIKFYLSILLFKHELIIVATDMYLILDFF